MSNDIKNKLEAMLNNFLLLLFCLNISAILHSVIEDTQILDLVQFAMVMAVLIKNTSVNKQD